MVDALTRWRALTEPFRAEPHRAAILSDFDGTLSAIVADPAAAAPVPGAVEALRSLADRFSLVGVVSGRPVGFLEQWFPDAQLVLAGQYGLEIRRGGTVTIDPAGQAWAPIIEQVVTDGQTTGPVGMRVEHKPLSVTVHYRGQGDLRAEVERWAATIGRSTGLDVRPARMSVELHPPVPVDKGTTVVRLVDDRFAALYLGDDLGDLPAFDALDELDRRGVATVRVAVDSLEAPPSLLERADLIVKSQHEAVELLHDLATWRAAR